MSFRDLFSQHASSYAEFRPTYPPTLFQYLASLVSEHEVAWDCATGNGQAARGLVRHFRLVLATDASKKQIDQAPPSDKIQYCIAIAEQSPVRSAVINLITVAQALHWLNPDPFFACVNQALKEEGIVAVWCYNLLELEPRIDGLLLRFYNDIVGPYWAPERRLLEQGYRTMPFPFDELSAPQIFMENDWTFYDLVGYLGTWSATQGYIRAKGKDPVAEIGDQLMDAWGDPDIAKHIRWPLSLRVGRKRS